MKTNRFFGGLATLLLSFVVLAACGEEQAPRKEEARIEAPPAGVLWVRGAGATFPDPLYKKWIERYQEAQPDVWVTYSAVGSGAGVNRFSTGSVDFGASDAAMSDEQIAQVDRGVYLVPATAGIIVVAYNLPGITGDLNLPRNVYADIFSGKITKWNDPRIQDANPDVILPDLTIHLVARRDSSGTTFAFTNHLSAVDETFRTEGPGVGNLVAWKGHAMLAQGNEGVAQRIKISEGAIGYVGYEFAKRLNLPMATLENKAGQFIKPGSDAGRNALASAAHQMPDNLRLFIPDPDGKKAYPIVTYSWLLLYGQYPDGKKAAAVKDFVTWGLTRGQALSDEIGFIPLPEEVVALASQKVNSIQ
ncbi:MAG: phosphate ABC transporter substrate-binding protein PstS [Hyphomicrobiales bacterium]|nr:phosphate ABC transporter substrate-binding protein PstS [Hyphomicrobiales bacterium]